jgi:NADPH:quinone reductase
MIPLPERMTVIAIRKPGGPEVLTPELRPVPQPAAGEILVKVAAAGVNRPDIMQRMGLYPPPSGATDIPGLEIAGEVVARGADVTHWKNGDLVMALVVGGGYAQYCLAHESHALPVPQTLSPIEAAAIPETYFTVWHNVFERGRLAAGETLLVHGGSSGIGTTAIQLAKPSAPASSRPPDRRKNAPPASSSAPMLRLTTKTKISSPRPKRRPASEAPTSSST